MHVVKNTWLVLQLQEYKCRLSKKLLKTKPLTWASCQREGCILTQMRTSHFINNTTRGSRYVLNVIVVLLFKTYLRVAFQHQNTILSSFSFQLQPDPVSSAFQHKREPVSFASQHQSEVRVQRETRVFAVTNDNYWVKSHRVLPT